MSAPRKLSQGRAQLGAAAAARPPAPRPPAPRPHLHRPAQPERAAAPPAAAPSRPPAAPLAPRTGADTGPTARRGSPSSARRPLRRRGLTFTHPPALPESCLPSPGSHPALQPLRGSTKECTFLAPPRCPSGAGVSVLAGLLGGRSLLGAGAAPRRSPLARAADCSLRPPLAPGLGSRARTRQALERLLSLPGTPRLPAASRPPHPPSPNSPVSRRLQDATPGLSTLRAAVPHTKTALSAAPGSAQEGQPRPGVGTRRPPLAAPLPPAPRPPGKARLPARVGHAVRCRLPSALTFAAEAVAEAAAAMFPC